MKPLVIFKFDNIVEICPKKIPVTLKEICFRALPNVHLLSDAENLLTLAKNMGLKMMLLAFEDEILVKESLYALRICHYFDELLIVDEYNKDEPDPECYAETMIANQYGSNIIYAHQPDLNLKDYIK